MSIQESQARLDGLDIYPWQVGPKSSVSLHGWQEITTWRAEDKGKLWKKVVANAGYFGGGIFGTGETAGRGIFSYIVGNSLSNKIGGYAIPLIVGLSGGKEKGLKIRDNYTQAKNWCHKSFDNTLQGMVQGFVSSGTNIFSHDVNTKFALLLKAMLDGEGERLIERLEDVSPITLAFLIASLGSGSVFGIVKKSISISADLAIGEGLRRLSDSNDGNENDQIKEFYQTINKILEDKVNEKNQEFKKHLQEMMSMTKEKMLKVYGKYLFTAQHIKNILKSQVEINYALLKEIEKGRDALIELSGSMHYASWLLAAQIKNIEEIDKIPDCFENDPILSNWKCPITQKPIRYLQKVKDFNIYYEREAINQWIRNRHTISEIDEGDKSEIGIEEVPPGWPKDIQFNSKLLEDSHELQNEIDDRLKEILRVCAKNFIETFIRFFG
ncbi:MAG: hypothetical protein K1000chlam3_00856 [Chlamydiae bacterium]|nr:hypothetical protein [Chlamydiota bacterium]